MTQHFPRESLLSGRVESVHLGSRTTPRRGASSPTHGLREATPSGVWWPALFPTWGPPLRLRVRINEPRVPWGLPRSPLCKPRRSRAPYTTPISERLRLTPIASDCAPRDHAPVRLLDLSRSSFQRSERDELRMRDSLCYHNSVSPYDGARRTLRADPTNRAPRTCHVTTRASGVATRSEMPYMNDHIENGASKVVYSYGVYVDECLASFA